MKGQLGSLLLWKPFVFQSHNWQWGRHMLYIYSEQNNSSSFLTSIMNHPPTLPLTALPLTALTWGLGATQGVIQGRGGMQLPGGREGTPAPGMETPGPDSSAKTGGKHSASSPMPGESDSPKKSHRNVDVPSKKVLILKKPQSYHMNKEEIEKGDRPTKACAVSFLYFLKSSFLFHHHSLPLKPTSMCCGCYHPRMSYCQSLMATWPRSTNNASPMPVWLQPPCTVSWKIIWQWLTVSSKR